MFMDIKLMYMNVKYNVTFNLMWLEGNYNATFKLMCIGIKLNVRFKLAYIRQYNVIFKLVASTLNIT